MESLQKNKHALQALAINEDARAALDSNVKKLVLSEIFWDKCQGFINLLKPVSNAITELEGDSVNLSIVLQQFSKIEENFKENLGLSPILKTEETEVSKIIANRRTFLVKKVHLAADLLNPKSVGSHLSQDERVSISMKIQVCLVLGSIKHLHLQLVSLALNNLIIFAYRQMQWS